VRNRPLITWETSDDVAEEDAPRTESPTLRFVLLLVVLLMPLSAVAARLLHLQRYLAPDYVAAWETTTTHLESLACRDGRILSADGRVLAHDRLRFDIHVHYRWIESPPDEGWLRQQTLARLSRQQRRDPGQVAAARQAVLEKRRRLWNLLATTTGRTREQLDDSRNAIQRRIERMVDSVEERRQQRLAEATPGNESDGALQRLTQLNATSDDLQRIGQAIVEELTTAPRRGGFEPIIIAEELDYHTVIEDVDLRTVAQIESTPSLFPGVRIRTSSERLYPAGDTAGHIVGVRSEVTPDEVGEAAGEIGGTLQEGDRLGRMAIERAYDQTLRGRRGTLKIVRDRRGEILSQTIVHPPVHGRDVVLTIDSQLQRIAEGLLDDVVGPLAVDPTTKEPLATRGRAPNGGCLIAMDVRTGDVIAAASAPRFDPSLLLNPEPEQWKRVNTDPRRPFFPRVTQMTVPPGSVFKILTSIALLESRLIPPDEPFFCQGFLDRPDRNRCYIYRHYGIGHGDMTLSDAICQSCNVYFFHAARSLGPKPIADWAARFGLGAPTGAEIPGEKEGHLPRADASGRVVGEQWYNGSTLQLAIGQSSLTVTPLQVVRMVAAVANDGYLVAPRFVQEEPAVPVSPEGSPIELVSFSSTSAQPGVQKIPGLSPGTLEHVRRGMQMVVEHHQGTGKRLRLDDVAIAGKTGTAEVGGGKHDHAWFVGFVPADAPRYAFVAVIEHGGSGGSIAGPVAKKFVEALLEAGLLPRRAHHSGEDVPDPED
jgi:penicillin-binding protein 2